MKSECLPNVAPDAPSMTVEQSMNASAERIYKAWTERFDWWFAEPGDLMMTAEIDRPYFFKTRKEWGSHPHYGRFVELEQNKLVVMTWVTGKGGTEGFETVIRLEITDRENGPHVRLTHSGFKDEASCKAHRDNWPAGLQTLDECLAKQLATSK